MIVEIAKLSAVKNEMSDTSSVLQKQLEGLAAITNKISQIEDKVSASDTHIVEIKKMFSEGLHDERRKAPTSNEATPIQYDFLKDFISSKNAFHMFVDAYVLGKTSEPLRLDEHVQKMLNIMAEIDPVFMPSDSIEIKSVALGSMNMTVTIFNIAGLIVFEKIDNDDMSIWHWSITEGQEENAEKLRRTIYENAETDILPYIRKLLEA